MSDQPGSEAPKAAPPARPPTRSTSVRPKLVRPPAQAKPSGAMKGVLLFGSIIATAVLLGLIGWRLYVKFLGKKGTKELNVNERFKEVWDQAVDAGKEIQRVQSRTWEKNEPLSKDDISEISAQANKIAESKEEIEHLHMVVQEKKSKPGIPDVDIRGYDLLQMDMEERVSKLRLYLADAEDVVNDVKNKTGMCGLYIPMRVTINRYRKATEELGTIEKERQAILDRGNDDEKKNVCARIQQLREILISCQEDFGKLIEYTKEKLEVKNATDKIYKELETLNEENNNAGMANNSAGGLKKALLPSKRD